MNNKNIDDRTEIIDLAPETFVGEEDSVEIGQTVMIDSLKKEVKTKKTKEKKMKKWVKTVIWLSSMLVCIALISYVGLTFVFDFLGLREAKEVDVNIPKGSNATQVANALEDAGVIKSAFLFKTYSKIRGYTQKFKYGVYVFSTEMSYDRIARKLATEGQKAEAVKVVIPEGATVDDIIALLESKGVCSASDFRKAMRHDDYDYDFLKKIPGSVYYKLEGYLYPDTYEFFNYGGEECAHRAIDKMLSNFDQKFNYELRKKAADGGRSVHDVLTMASIIEMEASSASQVEKQRVAAVFYNRLAWTTEPNLLGSSPTAEYPYGNGKYNTNKYPGLPPGPMCSPSIESIKAAIEPMANFDACYFVTDRNNKFYYNNTYDQHKATIADLKSKGLWA